MKTNMTLALLIFLVTSCGGNPHVHSSRGGLERSHPPLISTQEEEPGCRAARSLMGYEFYFSSQKKTALYPASFLPFTKCKSLVKEDFNSYDTGFTYLVSNRSWEDYSFELFHQAEKDHVPSKILYLEDIFSSETFPMEIESPVASESVTGKDRGVDSNNSTNESKDSLIWSFSAPIITFGAHVVNVESEVSKPVRLRLFDCDRALIKEVDVIYPAGKDGKNENNFIGFVGGQGEVCHVSLTASDRMTGLSVDEVIYGK